MILEACVETWAEAQKARLGGANRIELCSHLELDGLTPDEKLIQKTCLDLDIPVMVMIRPRGGNFVYSGEELQVMEAEIDMAKYNGASGIVLGLLTPDNKIDVDNTARLVMRASPLPVTFHKAIDNLIDPVEGVLALKKIHGITRILTSGGKPTALEGTEVIRKMIEQAGDNLTILVAGRVTNENVQTIAKLTGATELHGRKIVGNLLPS